MAPALLFAPQSYHLRLDGGGLEAVRSGRGLVSVFSSYKFSSGEWRCFQVQDALRTHALCHGHDYALYVVCKVCACGGFPLWCKRAKHDSGSATRGGASRLCLVLPFVAEPESCFARLRQSPEPDVKNIR